MTALREHVHRRNLNYEGIDSVTRNKNKIVIKLKDKMGNAFTYFVDQTTGDLSYDNDD